MRKLATTVVILGLACGSSSASISIVWSSSSEAINPVTTMPVPDGAIAQLIWSADVIIDPLDFVDPLLPTGNDILLMQAPTQFGGFVAEGTVMFEGENFGLGSDGLVSGYVYTRVFNSPSPGLGDWYDEGGLIGGPLMDQDPMPGIPDPSDFSDANGDEIPDGPRTLGQQIVPEPSAWAFMGLALLAAMFSRRRA